MNATLLIGFIFTIAGFFVYFIGHQRGVPNTIIWALFPILHGFHEFAEYFLDELNAPFIVERFEIIFAIGSSLMLLAAAFEFTGAIPRPTGKIVGFVSLGFTIYFLTILDEEIIDEIDETVLNFGILYSNPFRFFFGFVLVQLSLVVILFSYLALRNQAKKQKLTLDPRLRLISYLSVVFLFIFSLFEGFKSDNAAFITMRGITASLFVIIPLLVVLNNKPGLQRLLVISPSGELLFGYNFGSDKDVFDPSLEDSMNDAVLTAGFLAAITNFSNELKSGGTNLTLRSQGIYFTLEKNGQFLYALQSLNYIKQIEIRFHEFIKIAKIEQLPGGELKKENLEPIKATLRESFKSLY